MNRDDLAPLIVQEECAEVIQAISKVFRFGKSQRYPNENSNSNKENLEIELGQLNFAIDRLVSAWSLNRAMILSAYENKRDTHKQWENYFVD